MGGTSVSSRAGQDVAPEAGWTSVEPGNRQPIPMMATGSCVDWTDPPGCKTPTVFRPVGRGREPKAAERDAGRPQVRAC